MKDWEATSPAREHDDVLARENREYSGTGGVSEMNGAYGFMPAFCDLDTGDVYVSCYADGRPAPVHLYEGLPSALVAHDDAGERPKALKSSVVAGFVRGQRFYTRDEAARELAAAGIAGGC